MRKILENFVCPGTKTIVEYKGNSVWWSDDVIAEDGLSGSYVRTCKTCNGEKCGIGLYPFNGYTEDLMTIEEIFYLTNQRKLPSEEELKPMIINYLECLDFKGGNNKDDNDKNKNNLCKMLLKNRYIFDKMISEDIAQSLRK